MKITSVFYVLIGCVFTILPIEAYERRIACHAENTRAKDGEHGISGYFEDGEHGQNGEDGKNGQDGGHGGDGGSSFFGRGGNGGNGGNGGSAN